MKHARTAAFTAVELLIVMLVLAVILALPLSAYLGAQRRAVETGALDYVRKCATAAARWTIDHPQDTPVGKDCADDEIAAGSLPSFIVSTRIAADRIDYTYSVFGSEASAALPIAFE
ncbi:type II secretion system protein [Deinococcus pimensis]|uniref:type II secretion system protein n=1 Tax=Deinococcus pimensis TaxID=309888 RepID=UPI0004AC908E|nr:type II secretion system protein [Deinococcus pimensis]